MNKLIPAVIFVSCAWFFTGCAATSPMSILYAPSVGETGGTGTLYLKGATPRAVGDGTRNLRWVIGRRTGLDGNVTGDILSVRSSEDMVLDAFNVELGASGYRVEVVSSLPSGVRKGVELSSVQVEVEESTLFPGKKATGSVKVWLEIWKDGVKVKRLSYQASASDVSVVHGDRLPKETVEKVLAEVMKQAVPDIVTALELRPEK